MIRFYSYHPNLNISNRTLYYTHNRVMMQNHTRQQRHQHPQHQQQHQQIVCLSRWKRWISGVISLYVIVVFFKLPGYLYDPDPDDAKTMGVALSSIPSFTGSDGILDYKTMYKYQVNDTSYSDVDYITDHVKPMSSISVWYLLRDPHVSTLNEQIIRNTFMFALFIIAFLLY